MKNSDYEIVKINDLANYNAEDIIDNFKCNNRCFIEDECMYIQGLKTNKIKIIDEHGEYTNEMKILSQIINIYKNNIVNIIIEKNSFNN